MRIAAFDTIAPAGPITTLPARLEQTSSRATTIFQVIIGMALLLAIAVPFGVVMAVSLEHPSARDIILRHPGACLQIALGLSLWTALFALPLKGVLAKLNAREITLARDTIHVTEKGVLRTTAWHEPIAAYRGIAHHIRASVSGTRHELILVHPDRDRAVMLAFADRIHQSEIDRLVLLLGVTEIAPRALYGAAATTPGQRPSPALPGLGAAA